MRLIRDRPRSVELDEFLARPLFAHLATVVDGSPRESPVWFLWEHNALWIIGSRATDTFPRRIEHEPRCAVGIIDFDPSSGRVHHIGFRGRAAVEPFDVPRARRLLGRYLGAGEAAWDARFRHTLADRDSDRNVFVRFDPQTAVARDVSYAPLGLASGRGRSETSSTLDPLTVPGSPRCRRPGWSPTALRAAPEPRRWPPRPPRRSPGAVPHWRARGCRRGRRPRGCRSKHPGRTR